MIEFAETQCGNAECSVPCHPERSETESKDLRIIDTAKILRFAALTQDDRLISWYHFAENIEKTQGPTAGRVKTLPYKF